MFTPRVVHRHSRSRLAVYGGVVGGETACVLPSAEQALLRLPLRPLEALCVTLSSGNQVRGGTGRRGDDVRVPGPV